MTIFVCLAVPSLNAEITNDQQAAACATYLARFIARSKPVIQKLQPNISSSARQLSLHDAYQMIGLPLDLKMAKTAVHNLQKKICDLRVYWLYKAHAHSLQSCGQLPDLEYSDEQNSFIIEVERSLLILTNIITQEERTQQEAIATLIAQKSKRTPFTAAYEKEIQQERFNNRAYLLVPAIVLPPLVFSDKQAVIMAESK